MFRMYLQLICLPFVLFAITYKEPINGRWDWIKSYQETEAGGHYIMPNDLGYSMHMIIRNDSAYTYHNDTLVKSASTQSLINETIHSDTLAIQEMFAVDAQRISYWKKASSINLMSKKPQILFLCSSVNYAWGYQHQGWLIDSSGAIRNYNFSKGDSIGTVGQTDTLPAKIYNQLLGKSVPTGRKIPIDTLLFMQTLIEPASKGFVSYSSRCYDAGIFRYSAIMPSIDNLQLKEIVCLQIGDMAACNSASAAKKIARWLNSIDTLDLKVCGSPDSCLNVTTSLPHKGTLMREKPQQIAINDKTVEVKVVQCGAVAIRAFSLRGELLAKPFERYLPAGEHKIGLAHILSGVQSKKPLVLEISMNGIRLESKTVIISQHR
jgi:hypothetical protein